MAHHATAGLFLCSRGVSLYSADRGLSRGKNEESGRNSGVKRREREFAGASQVFTDNADGDGRQYKKPKSVGRNNPFTGPSGKFNFTGGDEGSTSSGSSYTTGSSSEDLLNAPLGDLLGKLQNLGLSSSEDSDSESYTGSASSSSEDQKTPKAFEKGNTTDLLGALDAFKRGGSNAKSTQASKILPKAPSKPDVRKAPSPKKEEEEVFDLSAIQGSKLRGARGGGRLKMPPAPAVPTKASPSTSAVKKPTTTTTSTKPEAPTASPLADMFTDEGGANTFQLFMRMNQFKKGGVLESEVDDGAAPEPEEEEVPEIELVPETVTSLVLDYGVKDDCNKDGMKRGKKGNMLAARRNRYQMEDTNVIHVPLDKDNKDAALFCVFDGHAGKGCSTSLTKVFPRIFRKMWTSGGWANKTDLTDLWKAVYAAVDQELIEYEDEGATSTTVLVWRNPETNIRYVQSANLGDSTSFLRRNGKAIPLSEDHKPTSKGERERIQAMGVALGEGQTRLNGLAVSRAFGNHFPKSTGCGMIAEPFVSKAYPLTRKDTKLIVASDGLWDIVAGDKAFRLVKEVKDPVEAAKKLCATAVKSRKCHDNVTVVVVHLRPERKSGGSSTSSEKKSSSRSKSSTNIAGGEKSISRKTTATREKS